MFLFNRIAMPVKCVPNLSFYSWKIFQLKLSKMFFGIEGYIINLITLTFPVALVVSSGGVIICFY